MTIIFATGNSCKLREASEILGEGFELVTPAMKGIVEDIPETGTTLRANSLQKAQYILTMPVELTVLLMIRDLRPISSAALPGFILHDMPDRRRVFLLTLTNSSTRWRDVNMRLRLPESMVSETSNATRRARFKTVITLILNGEKHFFEGVMEGRISYERVGNGGFGYDPVFIAD